MLLDSKFLLKRYSEHLKIHSQVQVLKMCNMLSEAFWTLPMCNALLSICHASSKRKDQLVDKHHLGRDKRNTACLANVNQMKPCNSQVGYWMVLVSTTTSPEPATSFLCSRLCLNKSINSGARMEDGMSDIACSENSENTLMGTNIPHQTSPLKMFFFLLESVGYVSSLECIPQQEPEFKFCMTYITFIALGFPSPLQPKTRVVRVERSPIRNKWICPECPNESRKKTALLSVKSWLFNRDPSNGLR